MLLALLQIAAEEAEKSKVPFFIAGGLFAAWAIVLFARRDAQPDVPGRAERRAQVIAVSVVLMAGRDGHRRHHRLTARGSPGGPRGYRYELDPARSGPRRGHAVDSDLVAPHFQETR